MAERVTQPSPQDFVHERLLEKSHFRFGGMDVHVDPIRRYFNKKMNLGAAFLDRGDAVRIADGVSDGAILDDSAVDEDILRAAYRPLVAERRDVAVDLEPGGFLAHLDEIGALAEQLEEPFTKACPPEDTRGVSVVRCSMRTRLSGSPAPSA